MLLTSHVAVGSAVGLATGNPVLGFFAAIISHFLCDFTPHVDSPRDDIKLENILEHKGTAAFLYFDIFISILVFFIMLLKTNYAITVMWGTFGGILPDMIDSVPFWSHKIRKYPFVKQLHFVHDNWHFTARGKLRSLGWATQIVFIVASFAYVFTR